MPQPPDFPSVPSVFVAFLTHNLSPGFALPSAQSYMQTRGREMGGGIVFLLPALQAGAIPVGWEHRAPAVTSITGWIWGWLLNLRWTSSSSKHCPARPALAPDFSLFVERNLMSERELSCWLCGRKAVQEEGTLYSSAPIAFICDASLCSHIWVPQESRKSTQTVVLL